MSDRATYRLLSELRPHPMHAGGGGDPLAAWKEVALGRGDLAWERLTPVYETEASQAEFPFMSRPLTEPADVLQPALRAARPWAYHVEGGGVSTWKLGAYNEGTIAFHRHRTNLISAAVTRMLGEEIKQADVLDLGCNCGVFTLDLADRGCRRALGVDLRTKNLEQAELLKRIFGVDNAEFQLGNVKGIVDDGRTYDVVLNLGLMYHLSTPFEVMRLCHALTRRFCVIDSITHHEPIAAYHVNRTDPEHVIQGDLSFELQPTYRGLLATIQAAGFETVVELAAPTSEVDLYKDGSRRCFVAFKDDPQPYLDRLL